MENIGIEIRNLLKTHTRKNLSSVFMYLYLLSSFMDIKINCKKLKNKKSLNDYKVQITYLNFTKL